jgi:hypothetical protein
LIYCIEILNQSPHIELLTMSQKNNLVLVFRIGPDDFLQNLLFGIFETKEMAISAITDYTKKNKLLDYWYDEKNNVTDDADASVKKWRKGIPYKIVENVVSLNQVVEEDMFENDEVIANAMSLGAGSDGSVTYCYVYKHNNTLQYKESNNFYG